MLTAYMIDTEQNGDVDIALADLEEFYKRSKQRFDEDPTLPIALGTMW